jgi:hypothetical protein
MNKSDFVIQQATANIITTIKILEEGMRREKDETLLNELKVRCDLLIDVLKELGVQDGTNDQDQKRVA